MKKSKEGPYDALILLAMGYLFGGLLAGSIHYWYVIPQINKAEDRRQEKKRDIEREQYREATGGEQP